MVQYTVIEKFTNICFISIFEGFGMERHVGGRETQTRNDFPLSLFFLSIFFIFLFNSCDNYNKPVKAWFKYYTEEAAITDYENTGRVLMDSTGSKCLESDGDKTLTFYLRNPQNYTMDLTFSDENGVQLGSIIPVQDPYDKSIVRLTYPESFLISMDCGGHIGGTITLKEHDTNRVFPPYSFSLKCNSAPLILKGQTVQTAGGKYVICFYLPDLSGERFRNETHSLYINGSLIKSGTYAEIKNSSSARPTGLAGYNGEPSFSSNGPSGYSDPYYYVTDKNVVSGDDLTWTIHLQDEHGLTSKSVTASTKVNPVELLIKGNSLLTDSSGDTTTVNLTTEIDYAGNVEYTWESENPDIATVDENGRVTSVSGGIAKISCMAELADGRFAKAEKEIRVLGLDFSCPAHFIKGQTLVPVSTAAPGFPSVPSFQYTSSNETAAVITSAGKVNPLSKGKTTLKVSASYEGKTVSALKEVAVHELIMTGDEAAFTGVENAVSISVNFDSPDGVSAPDDVEYSWAATNSSSVSGAGSTVSVSGDDTTYGDSVVTATVKINGKSAEVNKSIKFYRLNFSGDVYFEKGGTAHTFTASVSGTSETPVYTWTPEGSAVSISGSGSSRTATASQTGSSTLKLKAEINGKSKIIEKQLVVYDLTISCDELYAKSAGNKTVSIQLPGYDGSYSAAWESGTESVAVLSGSSDASRTIQPRAGGTTKIIVTATLAYKNPDNTNKTIRREKTIHVVEISGLTSFIAGEKPRALSNVSPDSSIQYKWESADSTKAEIDQNTGKITAKNGYVNIKLIASLNGKSVTETKQIKISTCNVNEPTDIVKGEAYNCSCIINPAISGTVSVSSVNEDKIKPSQVSASNINGQRICTFKLEGVDTCTNISVTLKITDGSTTIEKTVMTKSVSASRSVSISNLSDYFEGLANNSVANPIKLNITGLTETNFSDFKTLLGRNTGKYVDLSMVTLPAIENLNQGLADCAGIVVAPQLSNGTKDISALFSRCNYLKTPPQSIPNSVTNMTSTFWACFALQTCPTIPQNVEKMGTCFSNCTSLGSVTIGTTKVVQNEWVLAFNYCSDTIRVYVPNTAVKNTMISADVGISGDNIYISP